MSKVYLGVSEYTNLPEYVLEVIKRTASYVVDKPKGRIFVWTETAWYAMSYDDMSEIHEYIYDLAYSEYKYANLINGDSFEIKGCADLFNVTAQVELSC
jgi:hypothetical protein